MQIAVGNINQQIFYTSQSKIAVCNGYVENEFSCHCDF